MLWLQVSSGGGGAVPGMPLRTARRCCRRLLLLLGGIGFLVGGLILLLLFFLIKKILFFSRIIQKSSVESDWLGVPPAEPQERRCAAAPRRGRGGAFPERSPLLARCLGVFSTGSLCFGSSVRAALERLRLAPGSGPLASPRLLRARMLLEKIKSF